LKKAGWYEHRQTGSHLVLRHPAKSGSHVVVAMHAREIIFPKTLAAILEQAGMTADELRALL
jgi:predicted RNA binding protein YcfA (HicA-like mRNA interferase family)